MGTDRLLVIVTSHEWLPAACQQRKQGAEGLGAAGPVEGEGMGNSRTVDFLQTHEKLQAYPYRLADNDGVSAPVNFVTAPSLRDPARDTSSYF